MHLAEWWRWWQDTGEQELFELLDANWYPFRVPSFRSAARTRLFDLAGRLHEGANRVDVQAFLTDLRVTRWPEQSDKWGISQDRPVAEKVVAWYHSATGE
jgi:hypothetical protein